RAGRLRGATQARRPQPGLISARDGALYTMRLGATGTFVPAVVPPVSHTRRTRAELPLLTLQSSKDLFAEGSNVERSTDRQAAVLRHRAARPPCLLSRARSTCRIFNQGSETRGGAMTCRCSVLRASAATCEGTRISLVTLAVAGALLMGSNRALADSGSL